MQTGEITVQDAATFIEKYMRNEEHIQRLVESQRSGEGDDGSATYGRILEALAERFESQSESQSTTRTSGRKS